MIPRHSALLTTAVVAGVIGLSACTPVPTPEPTPTPLFASEAEAFKAAERVFRDYNAASNERRRGTAGAEPQNFLSGQALEDDINAQRTLKEKHLRIDGPNRVSSFHAVEYDKEREQVSAELCIDVTGSRVVDESGADVTPPSRADLVALRVVMTSQGDQLAITSAAPGGHSCIG